MRAALLLLLLAGCAEFPALDARIPPGEADAPPPALMPLDALLAAADARAGSAPPAPGGGRVAALDARAAALRGPVLTEAERARLAEAPALP